MNNTVYQRLRRILTKQLLVPAHRVRPSSPLHQLDMSQDECNEFFLDIEQQFHLTLDDGDLQRVRTLRDLAGCVRHALRPALAVVPSLAPVP